MNSFRILIFLLLASVAAQAGPNGWITLHNTGGCTLTSQNDAYSNNGSDWFYSGNPPTFINAAGQNVTAVAAGETVTIHLVNYGGGTAGNNDGCHCQIALRWVMVDTSGRQEVTTTDLINSATTDVIYRDINFTTECPQVAETTNICVTVRNNENQLVNAYFRFQGETYEQTLQPGQSLTRCYDVPTTGNYAIESGYTINNSVPDATGTNFVNLTDGITNAYVLNLLTNGVETVRSTNTPFYGGTADWNLTNNIRWPDVPADAYGAKDTTVRAAAGVAHTDSQNILSGLNVIDNHIQGIASDIKLLASRSGSNLLQVIITNNNSDNPFTVSNVWVSNMPTNFGSVSLALTNYATETTQKEIHSSVTNFFTKLLDQLAETNAPDIDTNFAVLAYTNHEAYYDGPSNYLSAKTISDDQAGQAGLTEVENTISSYAASFLDNFSSSMADYYPSVPMVIDFNYGLGTEQMDLDPLHYEWGANLAALIRSLMSWLVAFWFLLKITEDAIKAVMIIQNAHGVTPSAIRAKMKEKPV